MPERANHCVATVLSGLLSPVTDTLAENMKTAGQRSTRRQDGVYCYHSWAARMAGWRLSFLHYDEPSLISPGRRIALQEECHGQVDGNWNNAECTGPGRIGLWCLAGTAGARRAWSPVRRSARGSTGDP